MNTPTRGDAIDALLEKFGVDLTDWTHPTYPNEAAQHAAIVVIEIQLEILLAQTKGDYAAARIVALSRNWRDHASLIASYTMELGQYANRISTLLALRNLAITPFRARS